jgi:hypothetical protein
MPPHPLADQQHRAPFSGDTETHERDVLTALSRALRSDGCYYESRQDDAYMATKATDTPSGTCGEYRDLDEEIGMISSFIETGLHVDDGHARGHARGRPPNSLMTRKRGARANRTMRFRHCSHEGRFQYNPPHF